MQIVRDARDSAYRNVNKELILMYLRVGQFLSKKSKEANYGDGYIDSLSDLSIVNFLVLKASTAEDSIP